MRNPFSIHPSYTTGENPVSYNQKLGVATPVSNNDTKLSNQNNKTQQQ